MKRNELLLKRARSAYEWSRLRRGLRVACLVAPMMAVSLTGCGRPSMAVLLGVVLAATATALVWRGGTAGRAVVPGLVAGIASLVLPMVAAPGCALIGRGDTAHYCFLACIVGGLASGGVVAWFASRVHDDRGAFIFVAGAIAALAGSLGCVIVGLGGIAAMVVGVALVSVAAALRTAEAR